MASNVGDPSILYYIFPGCTMRYKESQPKSIYNVEGKANVVGVGTDFKFKIFSGKLLDVAPKSRLADRA
jgi:hypothetical protein